MADIALYYNIRKGIHKAKEKMVVILLDNDTNNKTEGGG